jgi:hypothetical protein
MISPKLTCRLSSTGGNHAASLQPLRFCLADFKNVASRPYFAALGLALFFFDFCFNKNNLFVLIPIFF